MFTRSISTVVVPSTSENWTTQARQLKLDADASRILWLCHWWRDTHLRKRQTPALL